MFWKVYQKENIDMNRTSETPAHFGCPKGGGKKWTFLPRDLPLSKFQIWNLEISSFEKNYVCPYHLISCESHVWKSQMIKGTFIHFHSSENEWIWMNIWLNFDAFEGLREQLFSFELAYFEISFVTK